MVQFGTDGVRGLANGELSPDVALALGRAAAEVLGSSRFVLGRDTRRSSPMLEAAFSSGICAAGASVELLGVVPTPAVAWASAQDEVAGAMISASHNPFQDNGIKLFAPGGVKLGDGIETQIESLCTCLLDDPPTEGPTGAELGTIANGIETSGWSAMVANSVPPRALEGLRVVLDCAHGSASGVAFDVFNKLGADTKVIGADPNGVNINDGFGSTNPSRLQQQVLAESADVGLAFDGDADRVIAVDNTGTVVDGDVVMAILAKDWFRSGRLRDKTVVVTVMSNLGFRRAMADEGIVVVETSVGDKNVLAALDQGSYSLGGEQSGHVICRDLATTGDGILTGVQLLDAVGRSEQPISRLADDAMTKIPQILRNVALSRRDPNLVDKMSPDVAKFEAEMGESGRILVRLSGTEPLLRVMVEHLDDAEAKRISEELADKAESLVK